MRDDSGEQRDRWTFDRSDQWGLGALLLVIVLVTAWVQVASPLLAWARGRRLAVPYYSDVEVAGLDGSRLGHTAADYSLLVPDPTTAQRWWDLLPGVGYLALVAAVAWLLFRLMTDIARGESFVSRNVRRLRQLAALMLVGWTVVYFADVTFTFAILDQIGVEALGVDGGPRAVLTPPLVPFAIGLVAALVGEAFKAGAGLQDDVDGLV